MKLFKIDKLGYFISLEQIKLFQVDCLPVSANYPPQLKTYFLGASSLDILPCCYRFCSHLPLWVSIRE